MNYAEIVIANANENLDRVFHYGVPENFKECHRSWYESICPFWKGQP